MTEIVPERTVERFDGEDCLYRDHRGYRVILDYDGSGTYHVLGDAEIVVDGSISAQTNGEFSHFVTVSTSVSGPIEAHITPNDPFPTNTKVIEIDRFSIADIEARKVRNF
ncbi:MAG: hypothetical protein R2688_09755 [Fimbriimonadaceae bacterium]